MPYIGDPVWSVEGTMNYANKYFTEAANEENAGLRNANATVAQGVKTANTALNTLGTKVEGEITSAYQPQVDTANATLNNLSQMFGLPSPDGSPALTPDQIQTKFGTSPMYQFITGQGTLASQRNAIGSGMNGSGNELVDLQNYGQQEASTYFQQQAGDLMSLWGATSPAIAASNAGVTGVQMQIGEQTIGNSLGAAQYKAQTQAQLSANVGAAYNNIANMWNQQRASLMSNMGGAGVAAIGAGAQVASSQIGANASMSNNYMNNQTAQANTFMQTMSQQNIAAANSINQENISWENQVGASGNSSVNDAAASY